MAKTNNNKKYPEADRQPRHKAAERIGKSQARQEMYNELTLEEKIARLPAEGAKKQRARLMALLEKQNAKAEAEKAVAAQKEAKKASEVAGQVQTQ